ncbi:MAG: transketolase [Ktedonobacterales bacterium]
MSSTPQITAQDVARVVIEQSRRANVGHIGSSLSIASIIAALYSDVLRRPARGEEGYAERDRFILSKGHAALALYAALYLRGELNEEQLNTYCGDGSLLAVHPEHDLPGIDFSTGSLGHGLSLGAGAALAARMQGSPRRVFVLLSDAECDEGSTWEAVMFAAHWRLANLVAILDLNGQQALGYTADVLGLDSMAQRWEAFAWDTQEVDGHSGAQIAAIINGLDTTAGPPHILVAHTTFGKGVSFIESQIKWHYSPLSADEYERALEEIGRST